MNLGSVDMSKVRNLAKLAGISDAELDIALSTHNLSGLTFSA